MSYVLCFKHQRQQLSLEYHTSIDLHVKAIWVQQALDVSIFRKWSWTSQNSVKAILNFFSFQSMKNITGVGSVKCLSTAGDE